MNIDKFIMTFNDSAFGEIDIILDNPVKDWEDIKSSVMREMHESALNCLQLAEWLEDYKNLKKPKKGFFKFLG